MAKHLKTAAVLGAGVMGSGIASHLAGAGVRTYLLDIVPPKLSHAEASDPRARNRFALGGIEKSLKAKPAPMFSPEVAKLITAGNFEDDLGKLACCDLVIEAVVENIDIKRSLYERIAQVIGESTILASNTSGLSLSRMAEALPAGIRSRFLGMHFFNPVRYMHLLEIIPGPYTSEAVLQQATAIGEFLGKGVVYGKDTTNFIANRIGIYALMQAIHTMKEDGLTIEEVDKIAGPPMGRAKSAAFNTGDIVGVDTFVHVADNCYDSLVDDEERDVFKMPEWIRKLVADGRLGRKTGAGFYKKESKDILVLDPETLTYRAQSKVRFDSLGAVRNIEAPGARIQALVNADDKAAHFAWKTLSRTLAYTARRVGEIADDIVQIDRALRWGFNWDLGPFEVWDALGVEVSIERMSKDGIKVPASVHSMLKGGRKSFYDGALSQRSYFDLSTKKAVKVPQDPKQIRLDVLREDKKHVVKKNLGASLVDLGDGCLCFEVHTKMNTIDADVITLLKDGIEEAEKNFEALVIGNDGQHFGAGANLMLIFMSAQQQDWAQIGTMVVELQNALQRLKYSKIPVVAAPFQYTFGGCCELAMAVDACQAHAETYIGLVEVGAGLVPGGGGCLRVADRFTTDAGQVDADPLPFLGEGSLNIAMAKVATGAEDAFKLRYLRPGIDGVSLNRDHLLYHAKAKALGLAHSGYRPPLPLTLKAAGYDAEKTIGMRIWSMVESGWASEHDALIARKIAHILCGGHVAAGTELSEQHYLDLEREAFLSLCGEEKTQARIQSLLMNNKPLRN
jgi:3-hydroxyacyl-CoA dehydrogenase